MTIFLYLAIGLIAGCVSGAMGIGGGVLLVPFLIWWCRFEPRTATGTSLAVLVPPIGLPAAMLAFSKRQVNVTAALWIAGAFVLGAYLGRVVIDYLPDFYLRLLFGLLMIYVAIRFMVSSDSEAAIAAAGLTSVALAWVGYAGLRLLGRRHLACPDLGEHIRRKRDEGHGDLEYYI